MSKRFIKRFKQFTDSPFKFAGWLSILLTTLVLAITVYFFYDSYPKDGRPMDIELPVISGIHIDQFKDPRELKFDVLKNGKIRITGTIFSLDYSRNIIEKAVRDYGYDIPIRIRADKSCSFKDISPVMGIIKDSKIDRLIYGVLAKAMSMAYLNVSILPPLESKNLLRIEVKRSKILLEGKVIDSDESRKAALFQLSSIDPKLQFLIIPDSDITVQRLVDVISECYRSEVYITTISDKPVPNETKNTDKPAN